MSSVALEVRQIFVSLQDLLANPPRLVGVLDSLGWAGDAGGALAKPRAAVEAAVRACTEIDVSKLAEADPGAVAQFLAAARRAFDAVGKLSAGADASVGPFLKDLEGALADYLITSHLEAYHPRLFGLLRAVGVIDEVGVAAIPGEGVRRRAAARLAMQWERLPQLLTRPADVLAEVYQWDRKDAPLQYGRLLRAVGELVTAAGAPTRWDRVGGPLVSRCYANQIPPGLRALAIPFSCGFAGQGGYGEIGLLLAPIPAARGGPIKGVLVTNLSLGTVSDRVAVGPDWALQVSSTINASGRIGVRILPGGIEAQIADKQPPGASFVVSLSGRPREPWLLFGAREGTRLELAGLDLEVALDASQARFGLRLAQPGLHFVLAPGEGDSFLRHLLGRKGLEFPASLAVGWSSRAGFELDFGAGLEFVVALDRTLGPLRVRKLVLSATGKERAVTVAARAGFEVALGAVNVAVDGVGVEARLVTCPIGQGVLGALDVDVGFTPPSGIELAIDAEAVKGRGSLVIDVDKGRYSGFLALQTRAFAADAYGILDTKVPGKIGWSLLFSMAASFTPAIQLGFGFVLSGVGGLIGVNRRLDEAAMREAVRGGRLDRVLFPASAESGAAEMFETLGAMFPVAEDTCVFGPMLKIGWGTPPIVTAMIGVFVSLPQPVRIALLGRLSCALPNPTKPMLLLNMDVAGSADFAAGTVGLDAQLHDSKLFGLELTGSMVFRARFKEQPGFLLSVGGFHPAFQPPVGMGALQRMGLRLALGPVKVGLQSYFALTSNTVQFGAAIDVAAKLHGLSIRGGAAFDALIVFQPFHFTASMSAYVEVNWGGNRLMGVRVALTLDGPNGWRARGKGTVSFLCFEKDFRFDERIEGEPSPPMERARVRAELRAALATPANWGALPGGSTSVLLCERADGKKDPKRIIVAPDARLGFSQRVAPLGVQLQQMGPLEPDEPGPFDVSFKVGGNSPDSLEPTKELFAPAAYLDLTDAERLSAPSFEPMKAGVAAASEIRIPDASRRYPAAADEFESIGELWGDTNPATPAFVRRDPDGWRRKGGLVALKVEPPRFVRAAVDSLAPLAPNTGATAWHEARMSQKTGQRILPMHAVRKAGG